MRQHGSRRVRPRLVSHGNEIPSDPELVAATLRSDRSADAAATPKDYSDADESITEILMPSDDAATTIAARDHLRCLNERHTRSERYFFLSISIARGKKISCCRSETVSVTICSM